MKCEKCNNEAVYYYKETVNGKTTEKHLCAECAKEEGLDRAFESSFDDMFRSFDEEFESFFRPESFFAPLFGRRSALPGLARSVFAPMLTLPRIEIGWLRPETEEKKTAPAPEKVSEAENAELSARRELNALREQLRQAVEAEDYEKAIVLRDQIREKEK